MSSQHASTSYSICHYDTLDVPNFDIAPKGWLDALCAGKDLEENTENEAISKSHRSVSTYIKLCFLLYYDYHCVTFRIT